MCRLRKLLETVYSYTLSLSLSLCRSVALAELTIQMRERWRGEGGLWKPDTRNSSSVFFCSFYCLFAWPISTTDTEKRAQTYSHDHHTRRTKKWKKKQAQIVHFPFNSCIWSGDCWTISSHTHLEERRAWWPTFIVRERVSCKHTHTHTHTPCPFCACFANNLYFSYCRFCSLFCII